MEKTNQNGKKRQKFILIVLGGVMGVILLVFSGLGSDGDTDAAATSDTDAYTMAEEYAAMLEARVGDICSKVDGVSNVQVFVSLAGGYRTVYAYDSQSTSTGYKSELVMSGGGSDKKAVISAYEYPEISGVGIVCKGADNPAVRAQIISLVSAALDVSTNKIYVANG